MFAGVSDDACVCGVSIGARTLETLANEITRSTQPPLAPTIERIEVDGKFVVAVTVRRAATGTVVFAYGNAFVRVGRTNQRMSPDEMRTRLFAGFRAENLPVSISRARHAGEAWDEREVRRRGLYERNRGLFLVHEARPSSTPGQVADVVIYLRQHGAGPLTQRTIRSVEYHLGDKFFDHTVVKTAAQDAYRLEVSAYSPMLCFACVNFDDGATSLDLERYIDF